MDDARLLSLPSQRGPVPHPGTWSTAPLPAIRVGDRECAVIARDDGVSTLAVDRADGRVWLLVDDAFTGALVAESRAIDAPAVADEESLWSVAAEELGYAVPSAPPGRPSRSRRSDPSPVLRIS